MPGSGTLSPRCSHPRSRHAEGTPRGPTGPRTLGTQTVPGPWAPQASAVASLGPSGSQVCCLSCSPPPLCSSLLLVECHSTWDYMTFAHTALPQSSWSSTRTEGVDGGTQHILQQPWVSGQPVTVLPPPRLSSEWPGNFPLPQHCSSVLCITEIPMKVDSKPPSFVCFYVFILLLLGLEPRPLHALTKCTPLSYPSPEAVLCNLCMSTCRSLTTNDQDLEVHLWGMAPLLRAPRLGHPTLFSPKVADVGAGPGGRSQWSTAQGPGHSTLSSPRPPRGIWLTPLPVTPSLQEVR